MRPCQCPVFGTKLFTDCSLGAMIRVTRRSAILSQWLPRAIPHNGVGVGRYAVNSLSRYGHGARCRHPLRRGTNRSKSLPWVTSVMPNSRHDVAISASLRSEEFSSNTCQPSPAATAARIRPFSVKAVAQGRIHDGGAGRVRILLLQLTSRCWCPRASGQFLHDDGTHEGQRAL
jgi:hypothetical protein